MLPLNCGTLLFTIVFIALTSLFCPSNGIGNQTIRSNGDLFHKGKTFSVEKIFWDCRRRWPKVELFLPVNLNRGKDLKRRKEIDVFFIRSLLLFWPLELSNTSLNIVVDAERKGSDEEYNELTGILDKIRHRIPGGVKISHLPYVSGAYRSGYDRQQHAMFWADNFTSADSEFVGFLDTDALFLTYVDREDLFEEGRPVVNARSGLHEGRDPTKGAWKLFPMATYLATGILEPMRCMSYFPVIIKTSHFKFMRDYLTNYHQRDFDSAFLHNISNVNNTYSQFGVMCALLFTHKHDEYKWYVHTETPAWNGTVPPPNPGQNGNLSIFTPEMYFPKPRVATHVRYRGRHEPNIRREPALLNKVLQRGYCISPPLVKPPQYEAICNSTVPYKFGNTNLQGYFEEMHRFEYYDEISTSTSARAFVKKAFLQRQERLQNCTHEWAAGELAVIMQA